ncbi:MAG: acetate/propionate family kinase [Hydrogenophilales bacterium]|nr:acetate/propionate family kinase [Hydrogenophilales bacterium]
MRLLTVNTGSSSVRLALYASDGGMLSLLDERRISGEVQPEHTLQDFIGSVSVDAVAHRVVHGGERLAAPCVIDAAVEAEIERLAVLAPLHNPRALAWIRACREMLVTEIMQVAVFDTGFYAALPEVARSYALPQQLVQRLGLRRYGFHGIAHQVMWRRWRHLCPDIAAGGRVISLQLGAGCSISAVADGAPQDTSMGFSPLEGLVMATRSGDLDPGLLLYLLRIGKMSIDELDHLLNQESGLRGMAGESDMRKLLVSNEPAAQLAVELYCYRARKYVGAYLAALGGADAIMFGGGVGEHAPEIRERILAGMEWAGIVLDRERNHAAIGAEARISRDDSPVAVWTIAVDEAQLMAEEAASLLMNR